MRARLESYESRGAFGPATGLTQRLDFGVRPASHPMPALRHHRFTVGDHAANAGIRIGRIEPLTRELERAVHMLHAVRKVHQSSSSGSSDICSLLSSRLGNDFRRWISS